jgi:rhamnogalacturonan endolyase
MRSGSYDPRTRRGSGYCATVRVTNRTARRVAWRASVAAPGKVTSLWDAVGRDTGARLRVRGPAYAPTLAPRASTEFGFCADR